MGRVLGIIAVGARYTFGGQPSLSAHVDVSRKVRKWVSPNTGNKCIKGHFQRCGPPSSGTHWRTATSSLTCTTTSCASLWSMTGGSMLNSPRVFTAHKTTLSTRKPRIRSRRKCADDKASHSFAFHTPFRSQNFAIILWKRLTIIDRILHANILE